MKAGALVEAILVATLSLPPNAKVGGLPAAAGSGVAGAAALDGLDAGKAAKGLEGVPLEVAAGAMEASGDLASEGWIKEELSVNAGQR